MITYRYGDAWERYPVQPGDYWRVGNADFLCGDITDVDVEAQLKALIGTERFIVYSDPPWTPANETAFRHKAGLAKGEFEDFVTAWCCCVLESDEIFLEATAALPVPDNFFFQTLAVVGYQPSHLWRITYKQHRPCLLARCAPLIKMPHAVRHSETDWKEINGMDSSRVPARLLSCYEPTLVFDPCVGMGLTARAAVSNGHRFIGCELHPRRMAVAIARQSKLTDSPPEHVSCLILPRYQPTENGLYSTPCLMLT